MQRGLRLLEQLLRTVFPAEGKRSGSQLRDYEGNNKEQQVEGEFPRFGNKADSWNTMKFSTFLFKYINLNKESQVLSKSVSFLNNELRISSCLVNREYDSEKVGFG